MKRRGFVLLTSVLITFLVTGLLIFLAAQVEGHLRQTEAVSARLYSLTLAENGIEAAKSLLPHMEIDRLLTGPDGIFASGMHPEWRNPLQLSLARRFDPSDWSTSIDDGLPLIDDELLFTSGYSAEGRGHFYLRFSNNREEDPAADFDRVVLVRSMGIVSNTLPSFGVRDRLNSVTLLEARLRKESLFSQESALLLLGNVVQLSCDGAGFLVEGGTGTACTFVTTSGTDLEQQVSSQVTPDQLARFEGVNGSPSFAEQTQVYRSHPDYSRLFHQQFWTHFESSLPGFSDDSMETTAQARLLYLPEGGEITGPVEGTIVASGNLVLRTGSRVDGLVIHLGRGELRFDTGSMVRGSVWMTNVDSSSSEFVPGPLSLSLSGTARLTYDAGALHRALTLFPATLLGWRIIFPEMEM